MKTAREEMEEEFTYTRNSLGDRYAYDLTLMNGEPFRVEGEVESLRGSIGIVYTMPGGGKAFDPNWYTDRRHYPWVKQT